MWINDYAYLKRGGVFFTDIPEGGHMEWIKENTVLFFCLIGAVVIIAALLVALYFAGNHKIRFDSCGGRPVKALHARRSRLVIMPSTYRDGYIFGGWYFDKACTMPAVISTMPRQSVKVYARWDKEKPDIPLLESAATLSLPAPLYASKSAARPKSFLKQLKASSNFNKETFTEVCACILGYKGVRVKYGRREALIRMRGAALIRATLSGNTLKLYYALKPEEYDKNIYHHKFSKVKRMTDTPLELAVRSLRTRKYAVKLADDAARSKGLQLKAKYVLLDYNTLVLARGGNALTKAGKSAMIVPSVNVQDVGVLSDDEAAAMTETKYVAPRPEGAKIELINIGTLSDNFADGARVDLNMLKRKKLADADADGFRVIGKNTLERSLTVAADGYNSSAVKMILLTGGRVIRLQEKKEAEPTDVKL